MAERGITLGGMTRRKRYKPAGPSYPEDWEVSHTWKHGRTELKSRMYDFQVKGERGWFTFDRHVKHTTKGVEWIDGFAQHPYGGFVSFYVERITRVRKHVEPKKPKLESARDADRSRVA